MNKQKTIKIGIVFVSVSYLLFILFANLFESWQKNQPMGYYGTPEKAYEMQFATQANVVLPCGDHMHMFGVDERVKGSPQDGVGVCATVHHDEKGWYVSGSLNVQVLRLATQTRPVLHIYEKPKNCQMNSLFLSISNIQTTKESTAESVLEMVRDTAGTSFVVRGESVPVIGTVYYVYGLVDVEEKGYQLYYNTECIYP